MDTSRKNKSSLFIFDFDNTHYINLFRIFCILSVILLHIDLFGSTQVELWQNNWFLDFTRNALAPVGFFFLISGMMFNKIYLDKLESKELTFKEFWDHKIVKFLPFTFLTTIIFYVISLISTFGLNISIGRGSTDIFDLLAGCFLGGKEIFTGEYGKLNAALWFINIYLFVNIVATLITLLYFKYHKKVLYIIPLFLGLGMGFLPHNYPFCNILFGRGLLNFFLGFYVFELAKKLTKLSSKGVIVTRIISLFLISFYIFSFFYLYRYKGSSTIFDYQDFGITNILFWVPLIFLCNGSIPNKIAELKPINFICSLTFDIYIWHQIVFAIIEIIVKENNIVPTNGGLYFFIILSSVCAVAIISYLFIDKNIQKLVSRFIKF